MRLTPQVYLVGGGETGLSDPDDCHVYLLDGGEEYALIDAGCGSERSVAAIARAIENEGLDLARLRTVLLTHWHFDHSGGARYFRERHGCRVLAPASERAYLEAGRDGIIPAVVDHGVEDGEAIRVGSLTLTAHCVPCHSEGITAYRVDLADRRALFAGDIVFINGIIGLINYPGSDLSLYRANLGRLAGLEIDALLPGHLLFTLGDGQRHIDLAIRRLAEGFVPYSIGQSAVSFVPSSKFGL